MCLRVVELLTGFSGNRERLFNYFEQLYGNVQDACVARDLSALEKVVKERDKVRAVSIE